MVKITFALIFLGALSAVSEVAQAKQLQCISVTNPPSSSSVAPCEPTEFCGRGRFWNYKTCSCMVGCDWIEECPQKGYKWDIFQCGCVEACPMADCPEGYYAEIENCECIPDPDATTTTEGYCAPKKCDRGYFWMKHPFCSCWLACDYAKVCPKGQKWDFIECGCADDPTDKVCLPIFCRENFIANKKTCGCECALTENDCKGPRTEFDESACECRRYPCDPARPCIEGEILDSNICDCVPDPNYVNSTNSIDGNSSAFNEG